MTRDLIEFYETWLPTPENINEFPERIRNYVHDLETRTDPAGEVRELAIARDTIKQLEAKILEIREIINGPTAAGTETAIPHDAGTKT